MAVQPCRRSLLAQGRHVLRPLSAPTRTQKRRLHSETPPNNSLPPQYKPSTKALPQPPNHISDVFWKTRKLTDIPLAQVSPELKAPRWQETPPRMKARVRLDWAKKPSNKEWEVNKSPERLDEMYFRLLGPGGEKLLPEELKWLAVTHKSFDYGRRGFNDKLALLGRFTMVMEAAKLTVGKAPMRHEPDEYQRSPFQDAHLASVDNLSLEGPKQIVGIENIYDVALRVGLLSVMRWKPRLPENLDSSGVKAVLTGGIMAIMGALNLQHGSVVASKLIWERVMINTPREKENSESTETLKSTDESESTNKSESANTFESTNQF